MQNFVLRILTPYLLSCDGFERSNGQLNGERSHFKSDKIPYSRNFEFTGWTWLAGHYQHTSICFVYSLATTVMLSAPNNRVRLSDTWPYTVAPPHPRDDSYLDVSNACRCISKEQLTRYNGNVFSFQQSSQVIRHLVVNNERHGEKIRYCSYKIAQNGPHYYRVVDKSWYWSFNQSISICVFSWVAKCSFECKLT